MNTDTRANLYCVIPKINDDFMKKTSYLFPEYLLKFNKLNKMCYTFRKRNIALAFPENLNNAHIDNCAHF